MIKRPRRALWFALVAVTLGLAAIGLATCADRPALAPAAGIGPKPQLPAPDERLVPTVNIAPAEGWPAGRMPVPASGFAVNAFAQGLVHPRWLYVPPNGDVLVAETNAPAKDTGGIRALVMKQVMKRAGAAVPSPDRITLLRDADGDGVAETRSVFLDGLHSLFGKGHQAARPTRRPDQSPLDEEPHRESGRREAVCQRRIEQQCGRERHRERNRARRDLGNRSRDGRLARVCVRPQESRRHGLAAADRRAVDGRQ